MAEIVLSHISKTYDPGLFKRKVQAVVDLSLEIAPGEVFGLIGPNGAGKSTTIRMILGMIRPDCGEVRFRGELSGAVDFRHEIGYLPENPYLYDHLNLEELLAFCGRVSGMRQEQRKARGQMLMAKLGLEDARKRPLRTYSKGMLQRAGICFALLHDPTLIILDEPMSGLDPVGRKMVFDLVMELRGEGKTIFFCSHILSDVERLCDRIGLMIKGRMVRIFDRNELFTQSGNAIHLIVPPLTEAQLQPLIPLVEEVGQERKGDVLTVEPPHLSAVYRELAAVGIEPMGIRAERISLEELFIQAVDQEEG